MTTAVKEMILTSTFNKLMDAWLRGFRRVFIEGGTWSSKTFSVMQLLKLILENYKEPILCTVTSESMPHLKRGAMRDWLKIMGDELIDSCWNKTDFIYTFPKSNCLLEFVSSDQPAKLRGGRRQILFINEANNVARDSYREADMRTELFTICDWNPVSEFWFHDEKLADDRGNLYIHTTYKDAMEVLPPGQRENIESYQTKDPNWWNIYGLGMLGKVEGLVYPHFEQIDALPTGPVIYGLDYGFSSDPTVLVKNVIIGSNLYSQQMFYDYSSLTNGQIAMKLDLLGIQREPIYPDPDEPKSAEEIRQKGYNVLEAVKGKGSVAFGIQKVNNYYQFWTKDSLECIKEQRNYRFLKNKITGDFTDETTHQWSHGMDARRYPVASFNGLVGQGHHSLSRSQVLTGRSYSRR